MLQFVREIRWHQALFPGLVICQVIGVILASSTCMVFDHVEGDERTYFRLCGPVLPMPVTMLAAGQELSWRLSTTILSYLGMFVWAMELLTTLVCCWRFIERMTLTMSVVNLLSSLIIMSMTLVDCQDMLGVMSANLAGMTMWTGSWTLSIFPVSAVISLVGKILYSVLFRKFAREANINIDIELKERE